MKRVVSAAALLALLDDAFKRAIGHIGVPGPEQQQGRQRAGQAAIAILKWMNFKKDDDEDGDEQQRMQGAI